MLRPVLAAVVQRSSRPIRLGMEDLPRYCQDARGDPAMEAMDQQQQFGVRRCKAENIIVTAFERAITIPSLVFDTGDG